MASTTRPPSSPFGGRVVASPDEIQVQEVPTDGTMALFLLSDGSGVIGKRWAPDGSIQTTRFVAEQAPVQQQEDPMSRLEGKVDGLIQSVAALSEQSRSRARKTGKLVGSEFLEAASEVDYTELMKVLDNHMTCIKAVCPKEYDAIMSQIRMLA